MRSPLQIFPLTITIDGSLIRSRGSQPLGYSWRSASLPGVILPVCSSIPSIAAASQVIARSAFSLESPPFIAAIAESGRYCIGVTVWSVQIAIRAPAFASSAAFLSSRRLISGLHLSQSRGPQITGTFSSAMISAIRWLSVPWIITGSRENSLPHYEAGNKGFKKMASGRTGFQRAKI